MLIISIVHDGTGSEAIGNYDITVRVNRDVVWRGRVEGHERGDWLALVDELVDTVVKERMEADDED